MSTPIIRRLTLLRGSFVRNESGQDLLEYALLTALVAVAGLAVLAAMSTTMRNAYTGWNTAAQNVAEPCPPKPAACP